MKSFPKGSRCCRRPFSYPGEIRRAKDAKSQVEALERLPGGGHTFGVIMPTRFINRRPLLPHQTPLASWTEGRPFPFIFLTSGEKKQRIFVANPFHAVKSIASTIRSGRIGPDLIFLLPTPGQV